MLMKFYHKKNKLTNYLICITTKMYLKYDLESVTKIMERLLFGQFHVSAPPPPFNNVERQWAKAASSYSMASQHCIGAEGRFLTTNFKIPTTFCHWLSEIYKKIKTPTPGKMRFYAHRTMLLQISPIYFNMPDYVTLHSILNIMAEKLGQNDA